MWLKHLEQIFIVAVPHGPQAVVLPDHFALDGVDEARHQALPCTAATMTDTQRTIDAYRYACNK